jgi:hypothetical protein
MSVFDLINVILLECKELQDKKKYTWNFDTLCVDFTMIAVMLKYKFYL